LGQVSADPSKAESISRCSDESSNVLTQPLLGSIAAEIQTAIPGAELRLYQHRPADPVPTGAGRGGRSDYSIDMESGYEAEFADSHTPEALWPGTFAAEIVWRDRMIAVPSCSKL
jgi:hypothetical protein